LQADATVLGGDGAAGDGAHRIDASASRPTDAGTPVAGKALSAMDLTGRTALVTGASLGIGRATAMALGVEAELG